MKHLFQHLSPDVFHDQVCAVFAGKFADLGRPRLLVRVDDVLGAQLQREVLFLRCGSGGNHARAELSGDLNRRRADAARRAHYQHPVTPFHLRAAAQHVHRRAAGQRQRRRGFKVHCARQPHQRALRHRRLFRKPAVAIDADHFAVQAERLLAARTKLALAAENVGLNCNSFALLPVFHPGAERDDASRDFTAGRARQPDGNRQAAFFQPEVEVVQAAGMDLNDYFARGRLRVRQIAKFELTWFPLGDELNGFHASHSTRAVGCGQAFHGSDIATGSFPRLRDRAQ